MATDNLVVLVLGAGPNVGQGIANKFVSHGYKVALASRSAEDGASIKDSTYSFSADFSNPESVIQLFDKVVARLGIPNVVVYNAAALTTANDGLPLSVSLQDYIRDLNINVASTFAAAKKAVEGFDQLPVGLPKVFIYTGNILNKKIMPALITLGVGKAASSHLVEAASTAYKAKGYRFYYGDQRLENGGPVSRAIDGAAHGDFFYELVESGDKYPWHATFVKDHGYVAFQ